MIRRLLLIVVLVMAGALPLAAQEPAAVSGRVLDQNTGQGIANAELRLGDDRRSSSSDGRYRFGSVAPGRQRLEVRAVGYAAQLREMVILPGQSQAVTIELAAVPILLDSVVIVGSREGMINGVELSRRGSDLGEALNGWEGIVVSRTGSGNESVVQFRGSSADQVLVLVDGFALNDPFTGRADLSRIHVRDVNRLTFSRGAQTARGGSRAMAGMIEIDTRQIEDPEAMLGMGTANAGRARFAMGSGSFSGAVMVERLPERFRVDLPSGGETRRANAGGEIWSLNAKARLGADLTMRGTLSDRGLPGTIVNPTPSARAHERSLLIGLQTGSRAFLSASLQWLDTRASDDAPPPGFVAYDTRTRGVGGTLAGGLRRSLELSSWQGEYTISADSRLDRFEGDAVKNDAQFYKAGLSTTASLSRNHGRSVVTIAPAIRLDWYSGLRIPLWSGRLDLGLARGRSTVSAAFGSSVTAPVLADLIFREGVGVRINPNLRPERVRWEGELGVSHALNLLGMETSIRVRGFYGRIGDMILWTPDFRFIWSPGNFDVIRRGGEATLEIRPGETLFVSGTAALSAITYDLAGGAQVRYRPRHTYSLHSSWSPDLWRFTLGWNHVGTRFTNSAGSNPLDPIDLFTAGVERQVGRILSVRGEVRDLADSRPVYIAGFPSLGRSFHLSLNLEFP